MADCLSANPPYRGGGIWLSADNSPSHTSSSRSAVKIRSTQACRSGTLFVPDTFDVTV
jgi:hypothetical protein